MGTTRKTVQPYTFADGTAIPKGMYLIAPIQPIYMDETIYKNADQFNSFRFSDLRDSARLHLPLSNSSTLDMGTMLSRGRVSLQLIIVMVDFLPSLY